MSPRLRKPLDPRDHVRGPPTASLTLLEYGDFQCPYCGAAESVLKRIERHLGHDLRVVFRHFPLSQVHPDALNAARAAEAAGRQQKFWDMHDLLFANQNRLDLESLTGFAASLGLDASAFIDDLSSGEVDAKIEDDLRSGAISGVNGTPTFFINGYRYDGGLNLEELLFALEEARRNQRSGARP